MYTTSDQHNNKVKRIDQSNQLYDQPVSRQIN